MGFFHCEVDHGEGFFGFLPVHNEGHIVHLLNNLLHDDLHRIIFILGQGKSDWQNFFNCVLSLPIHDHRNQDFFILVLIGSDFFIFDDSVLLLQHLILHRIWFILEVCFSHFLDDDF